MVTFNEQFPSKWLKASDLDGPVVTTIKETSVEPVKDMNGVTNKKCIVHFADLKSLILNRTNFESLVDISGSDDSEGFVGAKIELYTVETQMGEGIRIRAPGTKKGAKKPTEAKAEMNDEVRSDPKSWTPISSTGLTKPAPSLS
jgi:hypothetical protein